MIGLDTNILVYAFDASEPKKRTVCKKIVEDTMAGNRQVAVTTQVLAEFANAITRKVSQPFTRQEAAGLIGGILASANWEVFSYGGRHILYALSSERPFWDALIAQTFLSNGVTTILTENIKHFRGSGLTAKCPF